ncbi:MAG: MucB/RseB C-terminal domain-containing protein [Rugosibacter sp.]|nr:MucB/RseB C-terminal domain-containing protein [Rugosibacter sp.]
MVGFRFSLLSAIASQVNSTRQALRQYLLQAMSITALFTVSPAPTFAYDGLESEISALERMAQASQRLTYDGIFVYRSADRMETSRIVHTWQAGRVLERTEVLDGSLREMIRNGDETTSFFAHGKRLIVESGTTRRQFPALLPSGLRHIQRYYTVQPVGQGRVAGLDSRVIALIPRDQLRYGHEFWFDPVSGLLLRSTIMGGHGEPLDSFSFTQVNIGASLPKNALKPRFPTEDLSVHKVTTTQVIPEDLGWIFKKQLPGFQRIQAMTRHSGNEPRTLHVLLSDGVATISVFIELGADPAGSTSVDSSRAQVRPVVISSMGALNVYHRQLKEYTIVVVGEVPVLALKLLGDGIAQRNE